MVCLLPLTGNELPFKKNDQPVTSMPDNPVADAAHGAVLGALIGDAAGSVLEFLGRAPTPAECERALQMPGGGVFGLAPGQFTDDGEMTVALLSSLVEGGGAYDQSRAARGYHDWVHSSPFDVGSATGAALRVPGEFEHDSLCEQILSQAATHNHESKANGCLMRATPLGIAACSVTPEIAAAWARDDARLTHPHPSCRDATAAYVLAIRHLILQPSDASGAFEAAYEYATTASAEVLQWLKDAEEGELPDAHPMAGFIRIAFTHAFHQLLRKAGLRQAILDTLILGGDTDTNACIVGGLIGAMNGRSKLPRASLEAVLNCDTDKGQPRPERFTARHVSFYLETLTSLCL